MLKILGELLTSARSSTKPQHIVETDGYNLQHLSAEDVNLAREKVSQQSGRLRVLIHPLFDLNGHGYDSREVILGLQENDPSSLRIVSGKSSPHARYLSRLARLCRNSNDVLLLAEEHGEVRETIGTMRALGCTSNIIYYETGDATPKPKNGSYADISRKLANIGVSHIIVGGQYLHYSYDSSVFGQNIVQLTHSDKIPKDSILGCVGVFATNIANNHIDVTLSHVSYPDRRPPQGTSHV